MKAQVIGKILKDMGILPEGVAGHSLGEYSALVAADSLSFEDGLRLVKKRGQLMFQAGIEKPGTMAAIIGLDAEKIYDLPPMEGFKAETAISLLKQKNIK